MQAGLTYGLPRRHNRVVKRREDQFLASSTLLERRICALNELPITPATFGDKNQIAQNARIKSSLSRRAESYF